MPPFVTTLLPGQGFPEGGFLAAWFLIWCLVIVGSFVVQIVIAVFLYRDAKARGENETLWLVLGIVGGFVALVVWLVVRPKTLAEQGYPPYGYAPPYAPPPYGAPPPAPPPTAPPPPPPPAQKPRKKT